MQTIFEDQGSIHALAALDYRQSLVLNAIGPDTNLNRFFGDKGKAPTFRHPENIYRAY